MKANITLIHTNDLHSHFDRWPHTAAVVKRELVRAAEEGRPALYMDAGDHVDMSDRTSYGTRARANLRLLSDLGCCAYTLGNNETLRMQHSEISELAQASPFAWLSANMRLLSGEPLPGIQDWTIVAAGPVKVGIVGMTCALGNAATALGLDIADSGEAEILHRIAGEMRAAGAHVVVFLSHLGIKQDLELAGHGADVIVGGHTHTALAEPQWLSKTAIAQAGDYGRYVGVLDLEVDLSAGQLVSCRGRLVPVNPAEVPADEAALAILREEAATAEAALGEVVAVLPEALPHDPVGESRLGPWIAEALRRNAGAEVGLVPGGQALHGFPAGRVTRDQIMAALSPLFIPALLEFKGSHLQGLLEQSEDPACHGHLLWDGGMRPRGKPVGRIFAAGISWGPGGMLRVNGEPLDPERVYTVGAPSLLGFPEAGYSALAGVRIVRRYMPTFVREVFEVALRNGLIPERPSEGT